MAMYQNYLRKIYEEWYTYYKKILCGVICKASGNDFPCDVLLHGGKENRTFKIYHVWKPYMLDPNYRERKKVSYVGLTVPQKKNVSVQLVAHDDIAYSLHSQGRISIQDPKIELAFKIITNILPMLFVYLITHRTKLLELTSKLANHP
jgi:hypothetical protein